MKKVVLAAALAGLPENRWICDCHNTIAYQDYRNHNHKGFAYKRGKAVIRKGTCNFTIAGARKYWRMREMANPSPDKVADYIDIYF